MAGFIHHRLPSDKILFEYKHRCPHCGLSRDIVTEYDHYLTCALTKQLKDIRLKSIIINLDKLHSSTPLQDIIIHSIDTFYNNNLIDELPEFTDLPSKYSNIKTCIQHQDNISWRHFI